MINNSTIIRVYVHETNHPNDIIIYLCATTFINPYINFLSVTFAGNHYYYHYHEQYIFNNVPHILLKFSRVDKFSNHFVTTIRPYENEYRSQPIPNYNKIFFVTLIGNESLDNSLEYSNLKTAEMLKEFADQSTIHGLHYVSNSKSHWTERQV